MQKAHDDAAEANTCCLNEEIKKDGQRIADVIGGHGPWQLRHWAIFFLATLCFSMQLFSTLPLTSHLECSCTENNGLNVSASKLCNISSCIKTTNAKDELNDLCFAPHSSTALDTDDEVDLRCTNKATVLYAKCICAVGVLFASVAVYPLINRFGRSSVSLTCCFLVCACSLAEIWAFAAAPFLILKFIISVGVTAVYFTAANNLSDGVSEEFRHLYFYTAHIGWGLAHLILPLLTMATSSWTLYNIVITAPCFLLLLPLCFLAETPESYAARGLWDRAHTVMRRAARCNGYSLHAVEQFPPHFLIQQKEEGTSNSTWKIENYRHVTECLALFFMGFLSSLVYFTCMWLTEWLGEDKRNSRFALLGTTEIAAALTLLFFAYLVPVRRLWALATSCASMFLIIMFTRERTDVAKLSRSIYLVQMFFSSMGWNVLLTHILSQPLISKKSKCKAITVGIGLCCGLLAASLADFQKLMAWDRSILLILSVPNLLAGLVIGLIPSRFLDCLDI